MDARLRALNRFGLGARPGEADAIDDPRSWLRGQLDGPAPPLIGGAPAAPEEIASALTAQRQAGQDPAARQAARQALQAITRAEEIAILRTRILTERPFVERLVAFWSNHLAISTVGEPVVTVLAGSYEREAIRPHVLGRFEDMVLASARHPAMLIYLDNFQSIGPNSPAAGRGRPTAGRRGLNENYARELMELHTLGVDGGYDQSDVQELAKILTGWTVPGAPGAPAAAARPARAARTGALAAPVIGFSFEPNLHEPGVKTVLGAAYGPGGIEEGEGVIRALCAHPSTARFVARKLVTHFVADDPPPAAVDRIASVFLDTGGDLREVSAALIDLEDAWAEESRKMRSPQDWLVALLRATAPPDFATGWNAQIDPADREPAPADPSGRGSQPGPAPADSPDRGARPTDPARRRPVPADRARGGSPQSGPVRPAARADAARAVDRILEQAPIFLRQLRHPLWAPPSPAGFGDKLRDWSDPDSLLNRAELARTLATRLSRGGAGDPRRLLEVVELAPGDPLPGLLADPSIPPADRLALGFASPAFQWR